MNNVSQDSLFLNRGSNPGVREYATDMFFSSSKTGVLTPRGHIQPASVFRTASVYISVTLYH